MRKQSQTDDEIPLTHSGSNVTRETKARFDTLLRAALEHEENGKQERKNAVAAATKLSKMQEKKTLKQEKLFDKHSSRKSSIKNIEECSPQSRQLIQSGINLISSSDDEVVVMKEILNVHEEKVRRNSNALNKSTELLIVDEKQKDEKNSNQQIEVNKTRNNLDPKDADLIKKSSRRKSIPSEMNIVHKEHNPEKDLGNMSLKTKETSKKPVPLPRSKFERKAAELSKSPDKELHKLHKNNESISGSLSPLLPLDQLSTKDSTDDDVCIAPRRTDRKKERNKKASVQGDDKQEEIELKDLASPAINEEQKVSCSQKTSLHKSKRKSKEVPLTKTELIAEEAGEPELSYDKIIGIFIHRSDCLQIDPLVRHPLVKVHLLDANTGNYLKKSSKDRSVSFYYESKDVDYILPLMTEAFDYKERRSVVPSWEELLVFNEDFQYILGNDPPVLILFELLDFVNFNVASSQYRKLGSEGGWHHIAWAFLKPLGANGILNIEKQVRLQLYKPQRIRKSTCNNCDVYQWWNGGVWDRYPATIYVTVKNITPPEHLPPVLRSRSALQGELSENPSFLDLDLNQDEGETKSENENSLASAQVQLSTGKSLPSWNRLPSQSCKIPNHQRFTLPTASRGCFYLKFSNSGLHLACSISAQEKFNIIVYSILDGKEYAQFVGHQGLVYDLHWSPKDTMLLSASADCTACVWDAEARKTVPMQMLPHPSFVYCAQFHPGNSSVLVTGCCDHVVRVWNRPSKSSQYELIQELEGHSGFVSAITINSNGILYSSDSVGLIIEWKGAKGKTKKQWSLWKLNRNIDIRELRDTVVNKLEFHPGGQRLLIHVRDSRLRMLDLSTASIIQWFNGALNHRVQTAACLSPCGGLVFAASEDGTIRVWNADTGEQMAIYSGLQFHRGSSSVDYHPYEHMAAFASYGSPAQVFVCDYDKLCSGKEIGLQLLFHQEISVLGTSQSGRGDMNESFIKSSTPLGLSHAETRLPVAKRKKKKTFPLLDSDLEVTPDGAHFTDSLKQTNEGSFSTLSPRSTNITSPWKEYDDESSKVKLASIIEKMDQVLSRTPSKSSQQMSDSYKNESSKISNNSPRNQRQTVQKIKHKPTGAILSA